MNKCLICGEAAELAFRSVVLDGHDVAYFRCHSCGYLRTEDPYWIDEAYSEAIASTDTGIMQRNIAIAVRLAALLFFCFDPRGTYVDVAGGYGLLVRLMRDIGFNFYWEDKYCQNLVARGFETSQATRPVTAITAFEALEHTENPIAFISSALERFGTRSMVFTTRLYAGNSAPCRNWSYYAFETGQHISFFQAQTLRVIAARLGLKFFSMHGLHILTDSSLRMKPLAWLLTARAAAPFALYVRSRLGTLTSSDNLLRMGPGKK
ncbi:class I SAM-dependent methyltransferase [bacterium]|nr:MAG: class I SAM-dependent methyltransferase [bacterium]